MAIVRNIEKKIRINQAVSKIALLVSAIVSVASFVLAYNMVRDAGKSIYILDNGVPILAKQTDLLMNRPVEYKAQIDLFHTLFFTLTADGDFIKAQTEKALYLIDDSGMKEFLNLREKGFYNQVISSNSVMTVKADSIRIDPKGLRFTYHGKQTINRKTQLIVRNLVTEGYVEDVPRSPNNPHGVMIRSWKTTDNSDISIATKHR